MSQPSIPAPWARLGLTPEVLRAALHDPNLRRLQFAWMATNAGKWAFLVANLVFAYEVGGPAATGLIGLATFVVPMVLAPLSGMPAARWRPERVLGALTLVRVAAVALSVGLVLIDGPFAVLLVLVAVDSGGRAFTRSLHAALLPLLARSPAELVAANAASSAAEGIGTFAGPALGGALIAVTGLGGVYLAVLAAFALAVAAIAGLRVPATRATGRALPSVRDQVTAGARAALRLRGPRHLLLAFTTQTTVRGMLMVLTVVAAIELLGMGEPGTGLLNAGLGVGGFLGAVGSLSLSGRARLAPWVDVSLAMWGAPILLIGLFGQPAIAMAAMVMVGTANAVLDVTGYTLLQRTTPNAARVALFGLHDSLANGGQAFGGLVAPVMIAWLGIEGALVVTGAILPVVAVVLWPALRRIDDDAVVDTRLLSRIRADPLLAPLSMAIVEELAGGIRPQVALRGSWIMREGEAGDRYFLIESGRVEVSVGGQVVRESGPGESFGEIALLRNVPRTASVRALTAVDLLALDRDDFLAAVTGHALSREAADALVAERLAEPVRSPG